MSEQILEKLFDSPIKVKLLKLFLRNPNSHFLLSDIITKTQARALAVKKEVGALESIAFISKKKFKENKKSGAKAGTYFSINPDFDFFKELQTLVLKSSPASKEMILRKILKLGRIKLALIAGIFLNNDNRRVDLFLVGDEISHRKLMNFLKEIESEVGKEIEYAAMDTKEFQYRFQMFDRFVRDILEKPHERLVSKIKYLE